MNKDIDENEERKELYDACKKEGWFDKLISNASKKELEKLPENPTDKDLEKAADKVLNKGFIIGLVVGIVFVILCTLITKMRFLNSFDKFGMINEKLNEINYYMNKYALYEKEDIEEISDRLCNAYMSILKDDNYSYYFDKDDTADMIQTTVGEYSGIGVLVVQEKETKKVFVSYIYKGSSAPDAGIEVGDEIIKVEGEDISSLTLEQVSRKVKGKAGTTVNITIKKTDGTEKDVQIVRKKITIEEVYPEIIEDGIGYVEIVEFEGKAGAQLAEIKNDFIDKGVKGLIIDLRDNPGGGLNTLLEISDVFLDNKLVTWFENGDGTKEEYFTKSGSWDIPCVILVNENTASAAEAFSGAMQDYKNAVLVGKETFGKGIVQNVYKLHDGTLIKFTASKYFTPLGRNFDKNGIKPDYEVESDSYDWDNNQFKKAVEILKEKISKEGDYKWD